MNADDVGPELLHLCEVGFDLRPLRLPVVLDEPTGFVVVVVEPPRHERLVATLQHEPLLVFRHNDPRQIARPLRERGSDVRLARVNENAEAEPEGFALLHDDFAFLALREGVAAERVGDQHAVVSRVEPRPAEVRRVGHQCDADFFAVDRAPVIAPVRLLAPHLFLVLRSVAVENPPAALDRERRGDAHAQSHLFLIAEAELLRAGEFRRPVDEVAVRADGDREAAHLVAHGLAVRGVAVADRKRAAVLRGLRLLDELDVRDSALVPPEVGPAEVAEREPQPGVHGVVVGRVDARERRVVARHLRAAGRADVREVRAPDRAILPDVGRERLTADLDVEAVLLLLER